jgi:large conductance mechanosensitive channel
MGIRTETELHRLERLGRRGADAATSFLQEFRAFAMKGNVVDLAIGVIIGAAFGKIVDSLVKNILMPVISLLVPSPNGYLAWKVTIDGKDIPYGLFLGDILNFLIVAFALFVTVVKFIGWVSKRKSAEAAAAAPARTPSELLLTEIRDLLQAAKTP